MTLNLTPLPYVALILSLLTAPDSMSIRLLKNNSQAPASHSQIEIATAKELRWVPVSALKDIGNAFPAGANVSEINGEATEAKEYVLRIHMPVGYKVPVYSQEEFENITILSGQVKLTAFVRDEPTTVSTLNPQDFVRVHPGQLHSFEAMIESEIQFHGHGPFIAIPLDEAASRKDSK